MTADPAAPRSRLKTPPGVTPDPRTGILSTLVGLLVFSGLNGVVKAQTEYFPVVQIMFFRNAFALLPLALFIGLTMPWRSVRTDRMGLHLLHALLVILERERLLDLLRRLLLGDLRGECICVNAHDPRLRVLDALETRRLHVPARSDRTLLLGVAGAEGRSCRHFRVHRREAGSRLVTHAGCERL